ncbi:NAD-dependent epimerase/dehydratase family protein [Paenibacillus marinisediminis]
METLAQLEQKMSEPSSRLVEDIRKLNGDIMLLGVGGKMGPDLARLAVRAIEASGTNKTVYGVSRFSEAGLREQLEQIGVKTIACDLLDDEGLKSLPDVENIVYMAGRKFGTTGSESLTWAMNSYLPGRVSERFRNSNIVVFSSGNIYPFLPVAYGGATEQTPPSPLGEYAQSCLGRERVFEHFSKTNKTPMLMYRLNYAIDLRYGVLLELAKSIKEQRPINLAMGHFNCIWQGDANEIALRALLRCNTPPQILNVTGPETVSVRYAAEQLGALLGIEPKFEGVESENALLNNSSACMKEYGYPSVSLQQMIEWTAKWVALDGETINKPTHFQERGGKF